jgi:hypothetical protein
MKVITDTCPEHILLMKVITDMCPEHILLMKVITDMCPEHILLMKVITDTCPEYYIGYLHVIYYVVCIILFLLQCILNLVRNKHDTLIIINQISCKNNIIQT